MSEWHSKLSQVEVYHNNRKCTKGNNIESENRRPGKGGKRKLCSECAELNRKRR